MRILFFTNLPLPEVYKKLEKKPSVFQGWAENLRLALSNRSDFVLGFASISQLDYLPFSIDNCIYYNISAPPLKRHVRAWVNNWYHSSDFPGCLDQCTKTINEFGPDIIHIHGTEGPYGLIQTQTTIPTVISIQGLLNVIERQYFSGLEIIDTIRDVFSINFIKGSGLIHNYLTFKNAARREKIIIKHSRYFIGRTEFDQRITTLLNPHACYFKCDEILRSAFYTTSWNAESLSRKVIYCSSGGNPFKGIGCLLEAIKILKDNGDGDIELRISGPLENSVTWSALQRKIRKLDIKYQVKWLGTGTDSNVSSELANASIYIHPSFCDNSPNSLCEAMIVGTPCIASYVGGIPSLITNKDNGLLFPAGDPYSLAGKIQQLLTDSALATRLSEQAHQIAVQRHDPQKIAADMTDIYREVIQFGSQKVA